MPDPVHHAEVVYHANLIGAGLTCVGMRLSAASCGCPSLRRLERRGRRRLMVFAAAFGYLTGQADIPPLIRHQRRRQHGRWVKSMRKMVSIALSMTLYPKPWDCCGAGAASTAAGLYALYVRSSGKVLGRGTGRAAWRRPWAHGSAT